MWQNVQHEMKDRGFTVLAVALDTPDAARPWIEVARPTYPALIDRDHHVARLFNMVNVPEAVWIDEAGRIVRAAENAGSFDGFRSRDRTTGVMPEAAAELTTRAKRIYLDAVRDWAQHGAASRHVPRPGSTSPRQATDDMALAHAHFQLACHLRDHGAADAARHHFDAASRLHPASWCIWRQSAARNPQGFAAGPEFWARVDALGTRRYYERPEIEDMP